MGPLSMGPHQWPQVACVTAALWASTHWMFPKTGACEGFCGLGPKGMGEANRGQQGRPWQMWEGEGLGDHWGDDGGGACWGAWVGGSRRASPDGAGCSGGCCPGFRGDAQVPLLLHRVPSDSEGPPGSQEPLGKWYVCLGVGGGPVQAQALFSLAHSDASPGPTGLPIPWAHLGGITCGTPGQVPVDTPGGGGESRVSLSFVGDLRSLFPDMR